MLWSPAMRKSREIGIAIKRSMISNGGSLYLALMFIDFNLPCLSFLVKEFFGPPRSFARLFAALEDDAAEGNNAQSVSRRHRRCHPWAQRQAARRVRARRETTRRVCRADTVGVILERSGKPREGSVRRGEQRAEYVAPAPQVSSSSAANSRAKDPCAEGNNAQSVSRRHRRCHPWAQRQAARRIRAPT